MQQWVRWFLLFVSFLGLGACAKPAVWTKPGYTEEAWRADRYTCERDMRMSAGSFGGGVIADVRAQQFFERCLQAKGYYRVQ